MNKPEPEAKDPVARASDAKDELVARAAGLLKEARPKLDQLIERAKPRGKAVGRGGLRYLREHEVEIKQAAAGLARYRMRGPLGFIFSALSPRPSATDPSGGQRCPVCETLNMASARFCNQCGARLISDEAPRQES